MERVAIRLFKEIKKENKCISVTTNTDENPAIAAESTFSGKDIEELFNTSNKSHKLLSDEYRYF